MNILIKNARLVNEREVREGDLLMCDGRIARIDGEIPADGAEVIDAAGRVLMPGMICLLYTSPSPRDPTASRMPSSA